MAQNNYHNNNTGISSGGTTTGTWHRNVAIIQNPFIRTHKTMSNVQWKACEQVDPPLGTLSIA